MRAMVLMQRDFMGTVHDGWWSQGPVASFLLLLEHVQFVVAPFVVAPLILRFFRKEHHGHQ